MDFRDHSVSKVVSSGFQKVGIEVFTKVILIYV